MSTAILIVPLTVGHAVRLKPEVKRSNLAGLTGRVIATRHFEAEVSPEANRAAHKIDLWAQAKPDIPAEDWATVELDHVSLLPGQPRFSARLRVCLPTWEMEPIPDHLIVQTTKKGA